jgi:enamine deaminase RidA (YjgF/YER057c/UK114 family)
MSIQRHNVGKRLSEVVVHGNTVYLAGEVPDDTAKDITGQTQEVLAKIDKLLAKVGSDKSKLLSAQIFLPDMADFPGMNAAWEAWVVPGQTPARATIEAGLANPAYKVEIMCIAAI